MAKTYYLLLTLMITAGPVISQVPSPVPGWPYRSGALDFAFYALGRFGAENLQAHLFFNTHLGEIDKFNLDGSFPAGWPINCDTLIFGNDLMILDIDHDGRFEMLCDGARRIDGHYEYSLIFLIDDDGTVMPGFPMGATDPDGFAAADMDNDHEYEIIYFSRRDGIIGCLDRYGMQKPGWPIPMPSDINCVGGSLGDLDLDGNVELVVPGDRYIYVFKFDGDTMDGFPIALVDPEFLFFNGIWPNILLDIDQDGYLEIVMGANNWMHWPPPTDSCFVAIYEHTGVMKAGWPRYFQEQIVSSITPADIDNNGTIELGFQGLIYHFLGLNGAELPGWPVPFTRPDGEPRGTYSDLAVVDIDGDGDCELFSDFNILYADSMGHDSLWYYGYSYLFATDHFGQLLSGYPLTTEGSIYAKPPCFSLDPISNHLYMSQSSNLFSDEPLWDSVFLELYLFPDSTGPTDQWPMLHHDNLHSRNYNFVDNVSAIHNGEPIIPGNYALMQNYPNPFNSSTVIEFDIPREEVVNLSVYDILGRKAAEPLNEKLVPGSYSQRIEIRDRTSGVYFCILKTEKTQISRKMVLLK